MHCAGAMRVNRKDLSTGRLKMEKHTSEIKIKLVVLRVL